MITRKLLRRWERRHSVVRHLHYYQIRMANRDPEIWMGEKHSASISHCNVPASLIVHPHRRLRYLLKEIVILEY